MPRQTFFNLPKEKQDNLLSAAKKEFSNKPLNKASVSNIIKNADIPRGSFYQYFDGKEDAFYYLLEKQMKLNSEEFISILRKNNGDLFETFTETFQRMLKEFQVQKNRDFFRNVFLNMDYKMENKIFNDFSETGISKPFLEVITGIDKKKLNISNEEEVVHVMEIMMAVTFQNLMKQFARQSTFEDALNKYLFEINLLKKGLYRGSE
ncbi:TetR/AcrR family transcriptional regulator [Oceanobacillus neutriphilus]|uniref:TetR family transcriptional regulator n=1 Tax=Oceanobacillus neutriphilus TaxID=531815 RepID=A0ABQ2NQK6_9BACI|nr:TetR/AcrR family transcriptional regulator [Oceanobacillus neutriphilus]GGP08260.1 TetR family transcriptional regulator [Oceanobacillus neutriphilus]